MYMRKCMCCMKMYAIMYMRKCMPQKCMPLCTWENVCQKNVCHYVHEKMYAKKMYATMYMRKCMCLSTCEYSGKCTCFEYLREFLENCLWLYACISKQMIYIFNICMHQDRIYCMRNVGNAKRHLWDLPWHILYWRMQNNCPSSDRFITVQCRIFAPSVLFF